MRNFGQREYLGTEDLSAVRSLEMRVDSTEASISLIGPPPPPAVAR